MLCFRNCVLSNTIKIIFCLLSLNYCCFVFMFLIHLECIFVYCSSFFFWPCPWRGEVPGPGIKPQPHGVPVVVQWLVNPASIYEDAGSIPGLVLRGLRIRHGHELWCRSQTWLGSPIAVALVKAGGYSSDWTLNLGTSICHGCGPKRPKNKQTNKTLSHSWDPSHTSDNTRALTTGPENSYFYSLILVLNYPNITYWFVHPLSIHWFLIWISCYILVCF